MSMKSAEDWAEDFPVLVPHNLLACHPDLALKMKREYRARYVAFIVRIQADAFAAGWRSGRKAAL